MSQSAIAVDRLLKRLEDATAALPGALTDPVSLQALLEERGRISRELAGPGVDTVLDSGQLGRLRDMLRAGDTIRQSLVARRELALEQINELRAARRARNEFQPYRGRTGGQVSVDI